MDEGVRAAVLEQAGGEEVSWIRGHQSVFSVMEAGLASDTREEKALSARARPAGDERRAG